MNKTTIEWIKNPDGTQGYTWNPITGCLNGCEYCYARRLANGRLRERYLANERLAEPVISYRVIGEDIKYSPYKDPFYPRFWLERLEMYGAPIKPCGIFVCDMGELFGDWIPRAWQEQIFDVIRRSTGDRFYLLTKQPQNLPAWSPFPDNCWVGVTATNHTTLIEARHYLEEIEATIKFVSFEPLLEWHIHNQLDWLVEVLGSISWLIIGAQTKPYKPPKIEWVEEIVKAADRAGVKVFLKKNLRTLILDAVAKHQIDRSKYLVGRELRQEMPG